MCHYLNNILRPVSLTLCVLLFFFAPQGKAQTFNFLNTEASAIATGDEIFAHGLPDTLTVWCNDWDFITSNPTTWGNDISFKSNHAFVKFSVNNFSAITKYMTPVNYSYKLHYQIWGYNDPNDTVTAAGYVTDDDTLKINFNNDGVNTPYQDLNLKKYSGFYKLLVVLDNISTDVGGMPGPASLIDTTVRNFAVEASILTQHYDKKEYGIGPGTTLPIVTATPHPAKNYLDLNWSFSTGTVTPVNYELEWTYIDDYHVTVPGISAPGITESPRPMSELSYDFGQNSTKVWLSDNNYKIPLVYPRGYIAYRVRSVRPDSVKYRYPINGNWSIAGSDKGMLSTLSSADYYHISEPYMGDSLNWQYTASFAEGGRYKNVATFYDGLLKNRQSITRFNSNFNKLIATGNVYDHEGRSSIKSLPAPIIVPSFRYQYGLLLNSATSLPYKAADFDTGSLHFTVISPLAGNASANIYYSTHNPDTLLRQQKFVADAEGYPFLQTIYESGGQSRMLAQSGAGMALQIGTANYMSNSYVSADQPLLNSLFGGNVGWSDFYNMTVTADPNQQLSMTINDYHGKPMVSALIGNGPDPSTHAIGQFTTPDSNYSKRDILYPASSQAIDKSAGIRMATVDFFNEAVAEDSLQYHYSSTPFEACPGQFLSVKGQYSTVVTDKFGDVVLAEGSSLGSTGLGGSGTPFTYTGPLAHFPAGIGAYHVDKKLSFVPQEIDAVLDTFFNAANCFRQQPSFVKESVLAATFPCPVDVPVYDSDECSKHKWEMMQQLFPNAAYGKFKIRFGEMNSTPNSIYTISCDCYHTYALYGEDTALVVSAQGARGIVNYRSNFTDVYLPDTCVSDTFFTQRVTIRAYDLFDSTQSIYMPFRGENGVTGDTAMVGYYRITSNWNLGAVDGDIYYGGVVVGHVSQSGNITTFDLPVTVAGTHLSASLNANLLSPSGQAILFTFEGDQLDPYAHLPVSVSPYPHWTDPGCLARYQDTCMVNLPDTITLNGVLHTGLRTMDHVAFNDIYMEAVTAGNYSIAEALLPLHPQYCELLNCFADTFQTKLLALEDWSMAQAVGLMYLDDLVDKDPIKPLMTATGLFPSPADSLLNFKGGNVRLDSFIFMMAYCASSDSIMFSQCITDMFSYEISHHLLVSDIVKKYYFEYIPEIYLANRQRFVDSIRRHGGNSCGPCAARRMELDHHRPVFPPVVRTDTVSSFPGAREDWALGVFSDTDQHMYDSIVVWDHETDSVLNVASIDTIMERLVNCYGSPGDRAAVRSGLEALVSSGNVRSGVFTHEQIFGVLSAASIHMDDLCNPYIFNFSHFGNSPGENNCLPTAFYDNIASFLATTEVGGVLTTLGGVVAYSLDTTGNRIEREISRRLGNVPIVDLWADYSMSKKLYTIFVVNTGGGPDTVKIMLRTPMCSSGVFAGLTAGVYTATAMCLGSSRKLRTFYPGLVSQYSFYASVSEGSTTCNMLGWIDSIPTTATTPKALARCIPCTQMRRLYQTFNDTLNAYGVHGVDHPLYGTMLTSFMNNELDQQYSSYDYETFIQSCALADSMILPQYVGYATFKFNSRPAMDAFMNGLNAIDPSYDLSDSYRDSVDAGGSPELTVCVDLRKVPSGKLKIYRDAMAVLGSAGPFTPAINSLLSGVHGGNEIGFIYTDPDYPFSPADSGIVDPVTGISFGPAYPKAVWDDGRFVMRDFYNVVQTGGTPATPANISRAIYGIAAYLFNNTVPGVVFTPEYRSTINTDYFKPEKQAYLKYVYDFQQLPDYEVLSKLQADQLVANIPYYASSSPYAPYNAAYSREVRGGLFSNLYLWNAGMNTRYYDTLQHIVNLVAATGSLFHTARHVPVSVPPPMQLDAYMASDRSYWYRYFNTNDTLFNVYLAFPDHVPTWQRPQYVVAGPVIPMPGDSLNRYFGLNVTLPGSVDTLMLFGLSSFVIGHSVELDNVVMRKLPRSKSDGRDTFNNCERQTLYAAIDQGLLNYRNYMDSLHHSISAAFRQHVLATVSERLILGYTSNKKYFTLYNYDRAGNLTFTVPPAGTALLADAVLPAVDMARDANTPGSSPMPSYIKRNVYEYTSFNMLRRQRTINGGMTDYWYDRTGRLVFSQNAKQVAEGYMTYNIYDAQGRLEETGESQLETPPPPPIPGAPPSSTPIGWSYSDTLAFSDTMDYDALVYFIREHPRRDVVYTLYDEAATNLATITGFSAQEYLRKRISCVKYLTVVPPGADFSVYDHASHYSYDPQGNVQTLTQDFPMLEEFRRRYVRVDYDYDVISGKVNMLSYNRGFPDQYYQKYDYDADNRLLEVNTSSDGFIWRRDAKYSYYDHGPLARMEMGDLRVQGLDYAYTIQGWLKAMNGDSLNAHTDMGKDGVPGQVTARDAVAHTIDYFTGDYHAITGRTVQGFSLSGNLYNGNIAGQSMAIDTFQRHYKQYMYDQLNRIRVATASPLDVSTGSLPYTENASAYNYDADGNITQLQRTAYGTAAGQRVMDSLNYVYSSPTNDMLEDVTDTVSMPFPNDIKQHTAVPGGRYRYDNIGNLSANLESGQDTIKWNLYNKVKGFVNNTDTSEMSYYYDAMGNRVAKLFTKKTTSRGEVYLRDAQGNILSTYRLNLQHGNVGSFKDFSLAAHDIYGSSRLGQKQYYGPEIGMVIDGITLPGVSIYDTVRLYAHVPWYSLEYQDVIHTDSVSPYGNSHKEVRYAKHATGMRQYEVPDHLGNVLATLSDKRQGGVFSPISGSLSPGVDAGIDAWAPIVSTAYDYYPFGQYIPGRYTDDTATHCLTTTYSGMSMVLLYDSVNINSSSTFGSATFYHMTTPLIIAPGAPGTPWGPGYIITSTAASSGANIMVGPASAYGDKVILKLNKVTGAHDFTVYDDVTGTPLSATTTIAGIALPTVVTLNVLPAAIPHSSYLRIKMECTASSGTVELISVAVPRDTVVPSNIVSTVCNNDGYRYGFNGQIKENEIAGVGNHYTALYWEMDPKVGRRWNRDPISKPDNSDYSVVSNNPILLSDPLGDIDNSYEVDGKTGMATKVDDKGGNKIDYVQVATSETKYPFWTIPASSYSYTIPVETGLNYGAGSGINYRAPGINLIGAPATGTSTAVDDPFTSIGSGLVYGLGRKVAVSVGAKMFGTPQTTGTLGHAFFSKAIGVKYALNPNVEKVTFNLGYKKLWGGGNFKWGPRPDVGVLFRDGRTIAVEVMSKTDVEQQLINRNLFFGTRVGRDIEVKTFKIPWINYKK